MPNTGELFKNMIITGHIFKICHKYKRVLNLKYITNTGHSMAAYAFSANVKMTKN